MIAIFKLSQQEINLFEHRSNSLNDHDRKLQNDIEFKLIQSNPKFLDEYYKKLRRKAMLRVAKRKQRSKQTEQEIELERQRAREYRRKKLSEESIEERAQRQRKDREYKRKIRSTK